MHIATAEDAAALLRPFFEGPEGGVAMLHLDGRQRVIGVTREDPGGWPGGGLPVAAILGAALRLGADSIVVAYSPPDGTLDPSPEACDSTRRLAEAAAAVGIRLMDQLLFSAGNCRSYRQLGLL